MVFTQAELALGSIGPEVASRYETYFETIKPQTHEAFFSRGLFALASVHTTWKSNVALYEELRDLAWLQDQNELQHRIVRSRAGLFNMRTRFIWAYAQRFWDDPGAYYRRENEAWADYRARVQKWTTGLGHAKSSFFLELTYLHVAEVVCLDTHMLQLYGYRPGSEYISYRKMDAIEQHWLQACSTAGIRPVTACWAFWDTKQKKPDSRYWSYVLEKHTTGVITR